MKTGILLLVATALLRVATGQPHEPFWRRLSHRHHAKRADASCPTDAALVINTATATGTVTYEFEDVIVYVDDSNKPVSTTTIYRNLVASTPPPTPSSSARPSAPALVPSPSSPPPEPSPPASTSLPAQVPVVAPAKQAEPGAGSPQHASSQKAAPPPPAKSSSPPPPPPTNGGGSSHGPGFESAISYTPYNADNSCKSTQQVAKDFEAINGFEVIRLYGTDCDQVANVVAATKGKAKLFLGIFDINAIQSEVQTISSAFNGNWGLVNTVSVGNELVNSGKASAGQVTAAIGSARSALKAAGYSGPVVTVDTMIAMKNNPTLCTASDFCAINCHAFFDGNVLPEGAGDFVKKWAQQVSDAAGGKTVVVTESGWPTKGGVNNKAVASPEAHSAAISSLKSAFGGGTNLVLYGMYNDEWKKDSATTYGCEKYWGIYGDAPS